MSAHVPVVLPVMAEDCVEHECEHENEDDCPSRPAVACAECTGDGWAPLVEWPCLLATRGPADEAVKLRLLAYHPAE